MKKLLVAIVNFDMNQFVHLDRAVKEFCSFKTLDVKVVIHSNIPLEFTDDRVEVVIEKKPSRGWMFLPWTCRKTLVERANDYDFFIYTENDHLYTEHSIQTWIKLSNTLPDNLRLGFFQFEKTNDGEIAYPAVHKVKNRKGWTKYFQWIKHSGVKIGSDVYARFSNGHHAGFILNRSQLKSAIDILGNDFLEYKGNGNPRVTACVQVYENCGAQKVLCLTKWNDLLIQHLPNRYVNLEGWILKTEKDFVKEREKLLV